MIATRAEQQESSSSNSGGIFQLEVSTKNIGRIKYRDGEVMIAQNQQKPTNFFFTPFPYADPDETNCYENEFNNRTELGLQVELYTPHLVQAIKHYLYKNQPSLCGNSTSDFLCDVSLLPMNSIRLVQKTSNSMSTRQKYTLEDSWQSATLLLQSMEFIIYASNMAECEKLRKSLTERCRLPNFEVHYSLYGQQTIQKQLEVTTEHVTSTTMYNRIHAQFPSAETVVLTGGDFKELLSESKDRITMTLRIQEGFENLQDPMTIDKHLEQQLSTQQNDVSQNDVTRHDITGVDLSGHSIDRADLRQHDINQLSSLNNHGSRVHLKHHDKQRFGQLDKLFDSHSRSSSSSNSQSSGDDGNIGFGFLDIFSFGGGFNSQTQTQAASSDSHNDVSTKQHGKVSNADVLNMTNTDEHSLNVLGNAQNHLNSTRIDKERSGSSRTDNNSLYQIKTNTNNFNATKMDKDTEKQHILSRHGAVKLLRYLSDNIYLEGDIIKPRPINAHLVKLGKLSTNTKLFSNTVLVRMRSNVYVLPLRCKPDENGGKSKIWLTDRIDRIKSLLLDLKNQVGISDSQSFQNIANINEIKIDLDGY
ncbi:unnamed protein product [Rotaria socialis]|uniref:Uncharacterized protein n=1 Tax=Rotaria socialis TaxID=392032 RepID=A0A818GIA9_9BILA|nr:unnamed protein product [Rotaria socialis]CAF4444225.1 unnamed protein product [Rotaria socialis]